jgi:O-antigen ligase
MRVALALILFFGLITYLVPAMWPLTVFQVGIFSLTAVSLCRVRPRFSWPLVPLSFAILCGVLQVLTGHTVYAHETKTDIVRWTTYLAVFLTGAFLFRTDSVRRWFAKAMLWFAFVVSILATIQICTSNGETFWSPLFTRFVIGPILSPNLYAAFIEIVLPIALYESLRRERNALLYSTIAGVLYATLIASASRAGAVLGTSEIVLVISIMWARGRASGREVGGALLKMVFMVVFFTTVMGWEAVWAHLRAPDPMAVRREFYISSLHIVAAHPWFGTGLGTWATVYPQWAIIDTGGFANQAHNDWLQWTAEGGIPLGIMLFTLFLWSVRPALRTIWGLGVIAFFLHALVDYPFSRPALGAWPFLILAMFAASPKALTKTHAGAPAVC